MSDKSFEPTPVTEEKYRPGFARGALTGVATAGETPRQLSQVGGPTQGTDSVASILNRDSPTPAPSSEPSGSMQEFYQLYQELLLGTLALTGVVFGSVWFFYSLNIALNYLLGACTGVLYLRMLAKDVERLGKEKQQLSKTRLALLIGLIVLSSQWNQLQIMPIFLGFLTYKAALIIYVVRTSFISDSRKVRRS